MSNVGSEAGRAAQSHNSESSSAELYHALTQVDIRRVHTTVRIDDFDCITEDTRYIFYNTGMTTISILPLPAIKRRIQRNMNVEDFLSRKLVFIPSSPSSDLLVGACNQIIDEADHSLSQDQKEAFKEIKENIVSKFTKIFKYGPEQDDIKLACEHLAKIQKKEILLKEKFIRKILPLIDLLNLYRDGFYRPLIALFEPLNSEKYTFIHFSVEKVREYLQGRKKRLKFNILGTFTFSFRPEIHKGISNHVRIYAPEGLLITDVEFDFTDQVNAKENIPDGKSCKEVEKELNLKKKECFDDRCFYVQLGPEESTALHTCDPHFNVTFNLTGLLSALSMLWWLTISSPLILGALSWLTILPFTLLPVILSTTFVLAVLGLSATFLVAIGIYAMDKKIVRHFITTHIILVYAMLTAEILAIIRIS